MKKLILTLLLAALPLSLLAASGTAIPGGNQSTPFIINKPGAYYLAGNRVMTDKTVLGAIQILADNVTLDLNGFTLSYTDIASDPSVFGHAIFSNKNNVEVRNGTISTIPNEAVHAQVGDGFRLIDVRIMDSHGVRITVPGALVERCHITNSRGRAITIEGDGSIVRSCTVAWVEPTKPTDGYGIYVGSNCSAVDCSVSNTHLEGIGLWGIGALIEGCLISNANLSKTSQRGAITVVGTGNTVRRNIISGAFASGVTIGGSAIGAVIEQNVITGTESAGAGSGAGIRSLSASSIILNNKGASNASGLISGQYVNGGGNLGS